MKKPFLNIIILLIALSQGICSAVEENEELPKLLLRNKRIVNPNINAVVAHYVVSIVQNRQHICGGAILASNIVITAAFCVTNDDVYVLSGSRHLSSSVPHSILLKHIHPHYHKHEYANNLALIVVHPNIALGTSRLIFNRPIQLFTGEVRSGFLGILSGWGSPQLVGPNITYTESSHSAHLQILTWQDCAARYGNNQFTSLEFCTHDPQGFRRSGYNDVGSPLVVHGLLLGILSWARMVPNQQTPDVYTNLALPIYREWINQFLHSH